ncbi:hypothetical protein [Clostridium sp. DJ247]|nr:hypothetical protein [Clostridium sp. DJ247]
MNNSFFTLTVINYLLAIIGPIGVFLITQYISKKIDKKLLKIKSK